MGRGRGEGSNRSGTGWRGALDRLKPAGSNGEKGGRQKEKTAEERLSTEERTREPWNW